MAHSGKFTQALGKEAARPFIEEGAIFSDMDTLNFRSIPPAGNMQHAEIRGLQSLFPHEPAEPQNQVLAVCLYEELMAVPLHALRQQLAHLGLQSRMNVNFWLFDRNDLILRCNGLNNQGQELADTKTHVVEGDLDRLFSAQILQSELKDIRASPTAQRSNSNSVPNIESLEPLIQFSSGKFILL
jgi:hypothetical protein